MHNAMKLAICLTLTGVSMPVYAKDAAVEAPITRFVDAFNKGDTPAATATMTNAVSITDEFAPFLWNGAGAFAAWGADFGADAKTKGISDPSVSISSPTREIVAGDRAYVIVPAIYRFTQRGVKMAETAQMTFSLTKQADGWKISGWTWTGPDPSPVK